MTEPTITVTSADLFTNFRDLPSTLTSQNGVLIVGTAYARHGYLSTPATGLIGLYNAAQITGAWPSLGSGEAAVQASTTTLLSDSIVRYYQETGAPGATKGTQYGSTLNAITHNGQTTTWNGSGYTVGLNAQVEVGDYVRLDDNGTNILHTRVTGFQALTGTSKIMLLEDNIPVALRGAGVYFNVTLGEIADITLTASQLTLSSSLITIPASLTHATARTGSAYAIIGATLTDGTILGNAYASYQSTVSGTFTNVVHKLTTLADVAALFPNYLNPEDGLGFAAYMSLSPTVTSLTPAPILVVAPVSESASDVADTLDLVRYRSDYSTVAVLSEDPAIIALFKQLLIDRAANYQSTEMFVGTTFTKDTHLSTSTVVTINDSQTTGEQRTFSVVTGTPFALAVSGYTLRLYSSPTVYVSYVVDTVISSQTVTSTTAVPGGPLSNQTIQLWQHLSTAAQVTDIITDAQSYAKNDINLIFPDNFFYNGVAVPPYMMAAYLAAIRSYSAPQQLMSYVKPDAAWTSFSTDAFTGYEPQLAAGGVFVLDVSTLGQLYVRFPKTTDPATLITANEVFTTTVQFCVRYLVSKLLPLLGLYRMSNTLYSNLRTVAVAALTDLSNTNIDQIGPIINRGTVGIIGPDPTDPSTVIVPVTLYIAGVAEEILQLDITIVLE